jgi:branched-chain amino acid aminotransferase
MAGSQDYAADSRNEAVLIYLNGALVPRADAKVSIFDSGFSMGDGVWEGLRLHKGSLLFLDAHLDRLFAGLASIGMSGQLSREAVVDALRAVLAANAMTDGAHLRLMVTRGVKSAINQDPRNALGTPTLAITAEYKAPPTGAPKGLTLATSSVRCTPSEMFDMRLNSHSRLHLITALLEAIAAGADEALMLDPYGFVSSCNATNLFFVKKGEVLTSKGAYCFNGVTRANVAMLCRDGGVPIRFADFTLEEARACDEAFVTGTLGGVTPVRSLDGHDFEATGPVTLRVTALYDELKDAEAARSPFV